MDLQVPVCFCIFNRPDTTAAVFRQIRRARPRRLLVVSDGPRADRPNERSLVQQCREIATRIDWDCDVETCFGDQNLGCARRIASGLSWAFARSEQLIILEDDCVPDATFFGFCQQLLKRYADDPRVMMISGDNFCHQENTRASYYFSSWGHIWGWASWRRAWEKYDLAISGWPDFRESGELNRRLRDAEQSEYWRNLLDAVHRGEVDTWDYSWQFAMFAAAGLAVLPNQNLVSNIGHDARATHTTDSGCRFAKLRTRPLHKIVHPTAVSRNEMADRWTFENLFRPAPVQTAATVRRPWWQWLSGKNRVA